METKLEPFLTSSLACFSRGLLLPGQLANARRSRDSIPAPHLLLLARTQFTLWAHLVYLTFRTRSPSLRSRRDAKYFRSRSHPFGELIWVFRISRLVGFFYHLGSVPLRLDPIEIPGVVFSGPRCGISGMFGFITIRQVLSQASVPSRCHVIQVSSFWELIWVCRIYRVV